MSVIILDILRGDPTFTIWLVDIEIPSQGRQEIKLTFPQVEDWKILMLQDFLPNVAVFFAQCGNLIINLGFLLLVAVSLTYYGTLPCH